MLLENLAASESLNMLKTTGDSDGSHWPCLTQVVWRCDMRQVCLPCLLRLSRSSCSPSDCPIIINVGRRQRHRAATQAAGRKMEEKECSVKRKARNSLPFTRYLCEESGIGISASSLPARRRAKKAMGE